MPTDPNTQVQRLLEKQAMEEAARRQRQAKQSDYIERLKVAKAETEAAALKVQTIADELRSFSRQGGGDVDPAFVVYANAHARFAGAVIQGSKRTSSMDRLLSSAQRDQERVAEQRRQQEAQARAREKVRAVKKLELPTAEDFDEVYGEVVTNA